MLKAWLAPEGGSTNLLADSVPKAAHLAAAAKKGARFLILPVADPVEAAAWILACFQAPVAAVPLAPVLPGAARENLLAQLPAGALISPREALQLAPAPLPPGRRPLGDIWAVLFTSGSSGAPKGVALSGAALRASALAHAGHTAAGDATWLLDLPLYHVGGFSVISRAYFLNAAVAFSAPRFEAARTAAWIESGLVQGLSLVPTTLFRLLQIEELGFQPLRVALVGGAPCDPALRERALARGLPVRATYGMTEHCSQIATEREAGGGLEPLPGVDLRISAGGEILVRSACLATGFFRDGKLAPLGPLDAGFFPTGDLGARENKRLTLHGRKSEVIISGGVKIFPAEVEQELGRLEEVQDCAVTGLPDSEWGECVCALLVPVPGRKLSFPGIKKRLAERLDPRKAPRFWLEVPEIPRSAAGKALRPEIRALAARRSPCRA